MNYSEAEAYLYDLQLLGTKLGLHNITSLLNCLDNPHKQLVFVHIAGTNGKGSVCALLNALLTACGLRVGIFTSPHLISLRERIKINNRNISVSAFTSCIARVKKAVTLLNAQNIYPTFFEVMTAVAIDYFARNRVHIVIFETGMGGTYDSTNIVDSKLSIITNVNLDHCRVLGSTIDKIAEDKAGIIKNRSVFITAEDKPPVIDIFRKICNSRKSEMIVVSPDNMKIKHLDSHGMVFDYSDNCIQWKNLKTNLAAYYQRKNIILAINAVLEIIKHFKTPAISKPDTEQAIRKGLKKVNIPGRFQFINKKPPVILDVAHNPAGIDKLIQSLMKLFSGRRIGFVIGMLAEKDYDNVCRLIVPIAAEIFCVTPPSERSLPAHELAHCCKKYARAGLSIRTDLSALSVIETFKQKYYTDVLVVCGSFYLAGHVLKHLGKTRLKIMDKGSDYR